MARRRRTARRAGWRGAGSDPQPLRLAAGQGRRGLAEPQVTQADLADGPQRRGDRGPAGEPPFQGVVHAQAEHVGDGQAVDPDGQGGVVEAGAVAGRAADGDVGQVLDVEVDVAEPAAGRALALAVLNEKCPGFQRRRRAYAERRTGGGSGRTPRSRSPVWTVRSGRSARRRSGRPGGCRRGPGGGRARAAPTRSAAPARPG
jgi:hypothetical protein